MKVYIIEGYDYEDHAILGVSDSREGVIKLLTDLGYRRNDWAKLTDDLQAAGLEHDPRLPAVKAATGFDNWRLPSVSDPLNTDYRDKITKKWQVEITEHEMTGFWGQRPAIASAVSTYDDGECYDDDETEKYAELRAQVRKLIPSRDNAAVDQRARATSRLTGPWVDDDLDLVEVLAYELGKLGWKDLADHLMDAATKTDEGRN